MLQSNRRSLCLTLLWNPVYCFLTCWYLRPGSVWASVFLFHRVNTQPTMQQACCFSARFYWEEFVIWNVPPDIQAVLLTRTFNPAFNLAVCYFSEGTTWFRPNRNLRKPRELQVHCLRTVAHMMQYFYSVFLLCALICSRWKWEFSKLLFVTFFSNFIHRCFCSFLTTNSFLLPLSRHQNVDLSVLPSCRTFFNVVMLTSTNQIFPSSKYFGHWIWICWTVCRFLYMSPFSLWKWPCFQSVPFPATWGNAFSGQFHKMPHLGEKQGGVSWMSCTCINTGWTTQNNIPVKLSWEAKVKEAPFLQGEKGGVSEQKTQKRKSEARWAKETKVKWVVGRQES